MGLAQVVDERGLRLEPFIADAALGRHRCVIVLGLHVALQVVHAEEGSRAEVAKKVSALLVDVGQVEVHGPLEAELCTANSAVEGLGLLLHVLVLLVPVDLVLAAVALAADAAFVRCKLESDHFPLHHHHWT